MDSYQIHHTRSAPIGSPVELSSETVSSSLSELSTDSDSPSGHRTIYSDTSSEGGATTQEQEGLANTVDREAQGAQKCPYHIQQQLRGASLPQVTKAVIDKSDNPSVRRVNLNQLVKDYKAGETQNLSPKVERSILVSIFLKELIAKVDQQLRDKDLTVVDAKFCDGEVKKANSFVLACKLFCFPEYVRRSLYLNFRAENFLSSAIDHFCNDYDERVQNQKDSGDTNLQYWNRYRALLSVGDFKGITEPSEHLHEGMNTAVQTPWALFEIIPELYQTYTQRPISTEEANKYFSSSQDIGRKFAANHLGMMRAADSIISVRDFRGQFQGFDQGKFALDDNTIYLPNSNFGPLLTNPPALDDEIVGCPVLAAKDEDMNGFDVSYRWQVDAAVKYLSPSIGEEKNIGLRALSSFRSFIQTLWGRRESITES